MSSEQSKSVVTNQTSHTPETSERDIPVVAFLGPSGTFTEMAMLEFAGRGWCDTQPQGARTGAAGPESSGVKATEPITAHGHRMRCH